MAESSYLGDMLTTLFERRRKPTKTNLRRSMQDMCLSLLAEEGEVSGIHLAKSALDKYATLDEHQKLDFFSS